MEVFELTVDHQTDDPVVVLRADDGITTLPIRIDLMEAGAIAAVHEQLSLTRPLTHDVLHRVMGELGGVLESVEVTALIDATFYAELKVRVDDALHTIDTRPSDAIALALRAKVDIFVHEHVLEKAAVLDTEKDRWRRFLENLDPDDFGDYRM